VSGGDHPARVRPFGIKNNNVSGDAPMKTKWRIFGAGPKAERLNRKRK